MAKTRTKSYYDYRGYSGPDIDIETSLAEYGIIWKEVKKDEYRFVYGIGFNKEDYGGETYYTLFDYGYFNRRLWMELCAEGWFSIEAFAEYCGMSPNDIVNSDYWYSLIPSAISYHGAENIFSPCYTEGFRIGARR